jgi:hypothetical protein
MLSVIRDLPSRGAASVPLTEHWAKENGPNFFGEAPEQKGADPRAGACLKNLRKSA